jgi:N-acetylmuramoyl-L-alanine amidase
MMGALVRRAYCGRDHRDFRAASSRKISAILSAVRGSLVTSIAFIAAIACVPSPLRAAQASSPAGKVALQAPQQTQAPAQSPSPQQPQTSPATSPPNAAPQPAPPQPALPIIVLDPAHGGTDTGARGENGLAEKDVVLQIARTLQAQLLNYGYRVVLTRSDDSDPSYDERAALANAYRNAVFIAIHVGSSGKLGTVRAFYDQLGTGGSVAPSSFQAPALSGNSRTSVAAVPANSLIPWHEAQSPYIAASHRLADILQLQFGQVFPGSPVTAIAAPLRDLRSVAEPAVAIEISNIAVPSPDRLLQVSGPLSVAIDKAMQTFRQSSTPEAP